MSAAPDLRLAAEGDEARHYRVAIQPSAVGFEGELTEQGRPDPRRVEAADCAELAEALALMLVLSTEQEPAAALASPPPAPAAASIAVAAAPRVWSRPDADADADADADTDALLAREPAPRDSGVVLGGLVWWGAAPDPLLGVAVGGQHRFGPTIVARIEARAAQANDRADATYVGLAPQACACAGLSVVEVAACVGAAVGTLQVKGVESSAPRQSRAWLAPTLAARVNLPLGDWLFAELSAEGEHGFVKRAYRVKRDATEFKTPAFSALLTLALGARF